MSKPGHNALIHETSPYLLQHATNPVQWHPWGEAALRLAREQGNQFYYPLVIPLVIGVM